MSNDVNIAEERAVSLTLLDLKQAPKLFELTESLARELALAMDADSDELSLAVDLFLRSQTAEDKPFVDVAYSALEPVSIQPKRGGQERRRALG